MNNELNKEVKWSENVVLADADYIDSVAFNLIVNFERMIGRRIPQADMARWVDCVALDGGLRQGEHETRVVLIHDKASVGMKYFVPGEFSQLKDQAFRDNLGEFAFEVYPVEELTTKEDFFTDALLAICQQQEVKRIMVVAGDAYYNKVREALNRLEEKEERHVTVFAMQPMPGGSFRQEMLGYSLMAALGIRGEEVKTDN